MAIKRFKAHNIRSLSFINVLLSPHVNLFCGDNGSGKTSFLEAVHFLGLARSFVTTKLSSLIKKEHKECAVFAKIEIQEKDFSIGVARGLNTKQHIKINDKKSHVHDLAFLLPIQLLNSNMFRCLEASPSYRRRLVDWGVFYQNSEFFDVWKKMQISLKQRNSLLRSKDHNSREMDVWSNVFVTSAKKIDKMRKYYISKLLPRVYEILKDLTPLSPKIQITYYQGWSQNHSLEESLKKDIERDKILGYTRSGPQRADIKVLYQGVPAAEILSRGQQKIISSALKIAQGLLYEQTRKRSCIYLIDDLLSELDEKNTKAFIGLIQRMDSQILVTGTDENKLRDLFKKENTKMFHVKQGTIAQKNKMFHVKQ